MKILIGLDAEFMALKKGKFAFPAIEEHRSLRSFGCDEMGHCLEARPKPALSSQELIFNTMGAMSKLPLDYIYATENRIIIPKKNYFELLKKQGSKSIPECVNVYNKEILDDDSEYDRELYRPLFCGMHVHVSAYKEIEYGHWDEEKKCSVSNTQKVFIDLPKITVVKLFDKYIFDALKNDQGFVSGRYRQPGYYEDKSHGGFEYRSLGSSAFTPKRVAIIFDMVKMIVENYDVLTNSDDSENKPGTTLLEMKARLEKTKPPISLSKAWLIWK